VVKESSLILAKYKNELDVINFYLKSRIAQQFSDDQLLTIFQNFQFLANKFKKLTENAKIIQFSQIRMNQEVLGGLLTREN
jgi:hypothetical protein